MNLAPISRIILRYVIGGVFMGSEAIGNKLAADPDLVMAGSLVIGAAVETAYGFAKRKGWNT